jgi:hypothetical protein
MGSKQRVQNYAVRAKSAGTTDSKLNAIADAIYELADFVDDLENQLRDIETRLRRQ